jgi:hypothetical protein
MDGQMRALNILGIKVGMPNKFLSRKEIFIIRQLLLNSGGHKMVC